MNFTYFFRLDFLDVYMRFDYNVIFTPVSLIMFCILSFLNLKSFYIFYLFNFRLMFFTFSFTAIVQRTTVNVGQIKIQALATCLFLCMDACGNTYGSVRIQFLDTKINQFIHQIFVSFY
jgi:hypothetical protein